MGRKKLMCHVFWRKKGTKTWKGGKTAQDCTKKDKEWSLKMAKVRDEELKFVMVK